MTSRLFKVPVQVPDLSSAPATPPAGALELYASGQRPRAKNSAGAVFDLANIVSSCYVNGAERAQGVRIETRSFTTDTSDFTLTFQSAYSVAPIITVQAFTAFSDEVTVAEVLSINTTQAVIRTYRSTTHIHPLGASRSAVVRAGAFCHAIIIGVQ